MNVTELNADQLDCLRQDYNYQVNDDTSYVTEDDIPDDVLQEYFAGVSFMPDDFFSDYAPLQTQ